MATAVPSPTSSATTMSSGNSSLGSSPSQTLSTSQQAASFALLLKAKGLVERDFLTAMQSHTTAPGAGFKITDEEILAKLWATCKTGRQLSIAVARTLRVFRLCHPPEQKRLKQGYPVVSPMPALTDPARLSLPFSEKEEVDYLARALCIELKLPLQKRNIDRQREHAVTKRQKRKAAKAAAKKRVMGSQAPTPSLQLSLPNPPAHVMGAQAPAPSLQPSLPNPKSNSLPLGAGALVAPSASAASLSLSLMAAPGGTSANDTLSEPATGPQAVPAAAAVAPSAATAPTAASGACLSLQTAAAPTKTKRGAVRAMVELPEESVLQPKPAAAESSDSDSDSVDTSDLSDSEEEKINPPTSGSSNPGACAAAAAAGAGLVPKGPMESRVKAATASFGKPASSKKRQKIEIEEEETDLHDAEDVAFVFESDDAGGPDVQLVQQSSDSETESDAEDKAAAALEASKIRALAVKAKFEAAEYAKRERKAAAAAKKQLKLQKEARAKTKRSQSKTRPSGEQAKLVQGLTKAASVSSSSSGSEPILLNSLHGKPVLPCGSQFKWNKLTSKQKAAALTLGFSADPTDKFHWDTVRRAWRVGNAYLPPSFGFALFTDLTEKQQQACKDLKIRMDCYCSLSTNGPIAFHSRTWECLTKDAKSNARVLGHQQPKKKETQVWNELDAAGAVEEWEQVPTHLKKYKKLAPKLQQAVVFMDWSKDSWDHLANNIKAAALGRAAARIADSDSDSDSPDDTAGDSQSSPSMRGSSAESDDTAGKDEGSDSDLSQAAEQSSSFKPDSSASEDRSFKERQDTKRKAGRQAARDNASAGFGKMAQPSDKEAEQRDAEAERKALELESLSARKIKKQKKESKPEAAGEAPSHHFSPRGASAHGGASPTASVSSARSEKRTKAAKKRQVFSDICLDKQGLGLFTAPDYANHVDSDLLGEIFYSITEKGSGILAHHGRITNQQYCLPGRVKLKVLLEKNTIWILKLWLPVSTEYVRTAADRTMVVGANGDVTSKAASAKLDNAAFSVVGQFLQALWARTHAMLKCPIADCQGYVPKSQFGALLDYTYWLQLQTSKYNLAGLLSLDTELMERRRWGDWDFSMSVVTTQTLNEWQDERLPTLKLHCVFCEGMGHTAEHCTARSSEKELAAVGRMFSSSRAGAACCKNFNLFTCNAGGQCQEVSTHARSSAPGARTKLIHCLRSCQGGGARGITGGDRAARTRVTVTRL